MTDDLPFDYGTPDRPALAKPRKCGRHPWETYTSAEGERIRRCARCGRVAVPAVTRRNVNNRRRGTSDELAVARLLGGRKVGQLGLSWDVVVEGYLRAQCKRLDKWPSLNEVARWLDAIPAGRELRAVTLADTPGPGGRTRRLIVMELSEFAAWHGRREGETA